MMILVRPSVRSSAKSFASLPHLTRSLNVSPLDEMKLGLFHIHGFGLLGYIAKVVIIKASGLFSGSLPDI